LNTIVIDFEFLQRRAREKTLYLALIGAKEVTVKQRTIDKIHFIQQPKT